MDALHNEAMNEEMTVPFIAPGSSHWPRFISHNRVLLTHKVAGEQNGHHCIIIKQLLALKHKCNLSLLHDCETLRRGIIDCHRNFKAGNY